MTNLAVIVSIFLITNSVTYLHPSGVEGYRTNIVSRCYVVQTNNLLCWGFTNSVPISTNVQKMVWIDVNANPEIKMVRQPLSIPDAVNNELPPLPP